MSLDATAPPASARPPAALDRRFLFVTGKGGVGKTTVSAALALRLASAGRRVLLAETANGDGLARLFGKSVLKPQIEALAPSIEGVLLDADVALKEYGALVLKSERLASALFDNKLVSGFFHGAPGLKEWAQLGKAWYHSTETRADGRPRFDTVILDAPATGHGLDMLRVPKTIVELSPPGILRTDAERAWNQFRDARQSGVVVVTLPEEMPTNESLELCAALRGELGLPLSALVINQVLPRLFAEGELAELAELSPPQSANPSPAQLALAAGARRAARERVQVDSIARLSKLGAVRYQLPFVQGGADSSAALAELWPRFA